MSKFTKVIDAKTIEAAARGDWFSTDNLGEYAKATGKGAAGGAAAGLLSGGVLSAPAAAIGAGLGFLSKAGEDVWYATRKTEDKMSWQAGDFEDNLNKIAEALSPFDPDASKVLRAAGQTYKTNVDRYIQGKAANLSILDNLNISLNGSLPEYAPAPPSKIPAIGETPDDTGVLSAPSGANGESKPLFDPISVPGAPGAPESGYSDETGVGDPSQMQLYDQTPQQDPRSQAPAAAPSGDVLSRIMGAYDEMIAPSEYQKAAANKIKRTILAAKTVEDLQQVSTLLDAQGFYRLADQLDAYMRRSAAAVGAAELAQIEAKTDFPFQLFGFENPNAVTNESLKIAYRRLMAQVHPDLYMGDPAMSAKANEISKKVGAAYAEARNVAGRGQDSVAQRMREDADHIARGTARPKANSSQQARQRAEEARRQSEEAQRIRDEARRKQQAEADAQEQARRQQEETDYKTRAEQQAEEAKQRAEGEARAKARVNENGEPAAGRATGESAEAAGRETGEGAAKRNWNPFNRARGGNGAAETGEAAGTRWNPFSRARGGVGAPEGASAAARETGEAAAESVGRSGFAEGAGTAAKGLFKNPKAFLKGGIGGMLTEYAVGFAWDKIGDAMMGGNSYIIKHCMQNAKDILKANNDLCNEMTDPKKKQFLIGLNKEMYTFLAQLEAKMNNLKNPAGAKQPVR